MCMGEGMIELYPHQLDLVHKCRTTGKRSVLLQAPTGVGKSVIAAHIIHSAMSKGTRTIFTVPRIELLNQMSKNYNDFGIEHCFIAAGECYYPKVNNVIASVPSLTRKLDAIEPPKLLVVDETHYGEDGLGNIIFWAEKHGAFILGLSATPWRLNGKGLGCWYNTMVEGPSIKWLIQNNYLSNYRAFAPDTIDMSGVRVTAGDYNKKDLSERMESDRVLVGNVVRHYKEHAMGKRGITFTVSRAHSQIVCDAYNAGGVKAATIDGGTPKDERKRLARALATGEILQLVNAELLTFGYDLAAAANMNVTIQCISDLQPTKSLAKQMQKWGRALRFEGVNADPHLIFDHANNINEHGLPCDDRIWSLADRERRVGKKGSEKEISFRICPKCHFAHKPKPSCPECGFEYPVESRTIEEIEGDLIEIERVNDPVMLRVRHANTCAELYQIAKEKNYHWGWVKRQCSYKKIPFIPKMIVERNKK